jgi:hypothetical protein
MLLLYYYTITYLYKNRHFSIDFNNNLHLQNKRFYFYKISPLLKNTKIIQKMETVFYQLINNNLMT